MRSLQSLLLVLIFSAVAISQNKVIGTVNKSSAYCGGAYPGEEAIENIKKPRPFPLKRLYIKQGRENDFSNPVVLEFRSDSAGNFSISLPLGEYCIIDDSKKNKSSYENILKRYAKGTENNTAVDRNCLRNWFRTPELVFTVVKAGQQNEVTPNKVNILFTEKCGWDQVPCSTWIGSLPPSAPPRHNE